MEVIERKYREAPKSSKNRVKYLIVFIKELLKIGRVIEAEYYFSELLELKPSYLKTHLLGYEIAIKKFDTKKVQEFDCLLVKHQHKKENIFTLRAQYYYSFNSRIEFEQIIGVLLENKISKSILDKLIPMIMLHDSFPTNVLLYRYFLNNNLKFDAAIQLKFEKQVRKSALQASIDILSRKINDSIFDR